MHLLRSCIGKDINVHASNWASRLAASSPAQQAVLDKTTAWADQPWLVLEQLTKQLWHLHCRKQLGIITSVLRNQVRLWTFSHDPSVWTLLRSAALDSQDSWF